MALSGNETALSTAADTQRLEWWLGGGVEVGRDPGAPWSLEEQAGRVTHQSLLGCQVNVLPVCAAATPNSRAAVRTRSMLAWSAVFARDWCGVK